MQIVIVGAGEVGKNIATDLTSDHEITIIEKDPDRVKQLNYDVDALSIEGDGASLSPLKKADVSQADIVIASTDDDEANLIICSTVKTLSDAFTIARVKNMEYLRTWQRSKGVFGVDFMVGTNHLTAKSILRVINLAGARDVASFAGGQVEMAEFEVKETSPVSAQTVREADRYESLTFAAIFRSGTVTIPSGDTQIQGGDRVVVIGSPQSVAEFAKDVNPDDVSDVARDVVIIGGTEIGYRVARLLEAQNLSPRLIERDEERANELAEELKETMVLQSDATEFDFLQREHIGEADVLVAALHADEKNLLACILGERLGVDRTITVIDTAEYVDLFETVGIDVAIHPRDLVAEEITKFTREGRAENLALIEDGEAEVIEIEIDEESILANRLIRESAQLLPEGVVIGAITRQNEFVVPRGDTEIQLGDHVVVFVHSDLIDDVVPKL